MKEATKVGISFGLTSGIITTLGLMVGLNTGTGIKLVVIGGILTIAIADAFSDALGIHISEESQKKSDTKSIWKSTIATFITKLIVAASFIIALLIFNLKTAVIVNIVWGLALLSVFNYYLAKSKKEEPWKVICEHLFIAITVIIATYFVGRLMAIYFMA